LDSQLRNGPQSGSAGEDALENIQLIIFDCDGVLIDSEPIASSTLAASLRHAGVPISAEEAHARFTGNSLGIIRTMIERDYDVADVDALFAAWHEALFAEFASRLAPMPGILDVISGLSRPKCVASNSSMERLERSLGKLDLWSHFSTRVFSADAVTRPKPAPDLLLYCAREMSAAPEHCVMIDDSPHGVEAAVAAGMLAIGFVDPADPRLRRKSLLMEAGAMAVATGADELLEALSQANAELARHSGRSGT
jgi:HAD superfamily hydrolase (TIGR01509 family)